MKFWFQACIGCTDFGSLVEERSHNCGECIRCPFARCGSREDKFQLSEVFKNGKC